VFITFEGPEGAGKTTQARLLAELLRAAGQDPLLTREPGGTELGDRVRELVLPASGIPITARAEMLLYCVARAQLVEQVLRPALAARRVIIVDRYADSTLAYQAYGRGLEPAGVRAVLDFATGGLRPDLTLLLDLPAEAGLTRKQAQATPATDAWNRIEAEDLSFHRRVREAYLDLADAEPARWHVLDATRPAEEVADEVWSVVSGSLLTTDH
jgi:dTMP kinase